MHMRAALPTQVQPPEGEPLPEGSNHSRDRRKRARTHSKDTPVSDAGDTYSVHLLVTVTTIPVAAWDKGIHCTCAPWSTVA